LAKVSIKTRGIFNMAAERFGSKTDVVVKLVLVFFIALLSFSIGTFVGKKFSDNQYKLAQLEPQEGAAAVAAEGDDHEAESRGIASISPDASQVKPDKALSDDEIAKLAEEFVTDDSKEQAPGHIENPLDHKVDAAENEEEEAAPVQAHAAPAVTHEAVSPAAERLVHGQPAVVANKAPAPSRIPSSLPKEIASSALGKYTVQIASYGTEKEAQEKSADLKGKGFSAFYVSAKVKGTMWYRVSVGLFTTQKEAEAYKKDLLARAKVSSALVQKITSAD
jgi:cell division protein FtsN